MATFSSPTVSLCCGTMVLVLAELSLVAGGEVMQWGPHGGPEGRPTVQWQGNAGVGINIHTPSITNNHLQHLHAHTPTHTHTHPPTHPPTHTYTCGRIHIHTHTHTHTHMCTHTHAHTHIHLPCAATVEQISTLDMLCNISGR